MASRPGNVDCGILETQKEVGVKAHLFLNSDALPVIKSLMEANKEAQDTERVYKEEPTELSYIMRQLFKRAGLTSGNGDDKLRVRFHTLRGFLYNALSSVASVEKAKSIVGKKVSDADSPYLDDRNLREVYQRAMPNIVVNTNGTEVKRKLGDLESENKDLREQLDRLNSKVENLSTEKKAVLSDLQSLTTADLLALKKLALSLHEKKEPSMTVEVAKEVEQNE